MSWLAIAAMGFFLFFADSAPARAQQDPYSGQPAGSPQGAPPPASTPSGPAGQPYTTESPQQLEQVVAPIALYPDQLVASILAAAGYPAEITEANAWLQSHRNLPPQELAAETNSQPWDNSVKALLPFPPVLQNMASNLSWTSELGDAYYNQQADVMNAIQTLRQQAKRAGTLKSNDQIKVTDKDGYISIEAYNPQQQVYIPQYDPWQVYGYPIAPWPGWVEVPGLWWAGPGLYFGVGFGLGPWWGFGWGWPFWGVDWYHHGIFFNHAPYFARGPAFFNRYNYYRGYPGFARPAPYDRGFSRGYAAPRPGMGMRSGPFGGYNYGGSARNFSARGQGSFGGGFRGGGFGGGGFRGGGGVRGGGGRR